MILTIPVLLYQLLFVLILYIASRFGKTALTITLVGCLIWTATHIFLPPLMALQGAVILASYFYFRKRLTLTPVASDHPPQGTPPMR